MAEEKKKEEVKEEVAEPEPEMVLNTILEYQGKKYYWTKKNGYAEPVKVYVK
jgi:hypothetical protein|tara:strand:- start:391 stop:546 length:156 start_codon:yes stop_codon:yes gene_type:complete